MNTISDAGLPVRLAGNTKPWPPVSSITMSSMVTAPVDSGTRWGRRAFIRAAGISHTNDFKSTSLQSAPLTSPERLAVSTRNSNASFVEMLAVDSLTRLTAPGTWAYGKALWDSFSSCVLGRAFLRERPAGLSSR